MILENWLAIRIYFVELESWVLFGCWMMSLDHRYLNKIDHRPKKRDESNRFLCISAYVNGYAINEFIAWFKKQFLYLMLCFSSVPLHGTLISALLPAIIGNISS